jgi:nicotinamidase-related amidase
VRRRLGVAIVSYALHRPPRTSPSTDVPLGPLRAPLVAVVPRRSYGPTLMQRFGLVVVDPVRAFTDPDGVIGRIHGAVEFRPIRETVERLASFAATHEGPKVWVTSLYTPGQFTAGNLDELLARLCTDPSGSDCVWDADLEPPGDAVVVTKTSMDANSAPAFVDAVEAMVDEVDALFITGFWLTACVAATAASSTERLAGRTPVVIPLSLAATRLGLYDTAGDHPPERDVALRLEELRRRGVVVCEYPGEWRSNLVGT